MIDASTLTGANLHGYTIVRLLGSAALDGYFKRATGSWGTAH
jgi:hypothetical protein